MTSKAQMTASLIGAGMVARTHVAAIAASDRVTLRSICARSEARAHDLAKDASGMVGQPVDVTTDLANIAADKNVDFAIILTPPNARPELIRPLAQAGKHILLEKPVGRNATEAREVVQICKDAGVTLGIVFQHRMRAASIAAADLIAKDNLGALGVVEINVPWWRDQSYYDEAGRGTYDRDGGGVLISQAIHTIDLALSLTGPVKSVQAMTATTRFHKMEAEDFVTAGIKFANGAVGSMVASTASFPGDAESIRLHFEKASLTLASGELHIHWRNGRTEVQGAAGGTGGGADPMAFTHEWHQSIIEDFADAITTNRTPIVNGETALIAHDFIDAIERSAKHGRVEDLMP